jgi:hypothetical protein
VPKPRYGAYLNYKYRGISGQGIGLFRNMPTGSINAAFANKNGQVVPRLRRNRENSGNSDGGRTD